MGQLSAARLPFSIWIAGYTSTSWWQGADFTSEHLGLLLVRPLQAVEEGIDNAEIGEDVTLGFVVHLQKSGLLAIVHNFKLI